MRPNKYLNSAIRERLCGCGVKGHELMPVQRLVVIVLGLICSSSIYCFETPFMIPFLVSDKEVFKNMDFHLFSFRIGSNICFDTVVMGTGEFNVMSFSPHLIAIWIFILSHLCTYAYFFNIMYSDVASNESSPVTDQN